jgi:ADP-ribose pyrophosphatase
MRTIIVGDGLTKEFLSAEEPFASSRNNVGRSEIDRLLGRGKAFGQGPLPSFLRLAGEKAAMESGVGLILIGGSDSPRGGSESEPTDPKQAFPEILADSVSLATIVESPGDAIPWKGLWTAISGEDATAAGSDDLLFFVVGCHSDRRILALTSYLRTVLGLANVAVSPHLLGSATPEAHFAALRHNFPRAGVRVFLDLEEAAEYAGLDPSRVSSLGCRPPELGPLETSEALAPQQKRILETLCMNWTRADLRPLAGGFSGSLLLLARGWKGQARTEPQVLKVDNFSQMRRELAGYHQVKDFLGKHVPTFGYPVSHDDSIGVGMELAAMEGSPSTLQSAFEEADTDEALNRFLVRLDKSLCLLSEKLYQNTSEMTWVVPYRAFGLHAERQVKYLASNAEIILSYLADDLPRDARIDPQQLAKLLRLVARNPDGTDSEVCLVHGDLNFANVICDEVDNIWFIDWTHCGYAPLEIDFAKLEADVKFVMSKAFDVGDLPRLRMLEEYLLEQRIPGEPNALPEKLKFVKWDLRFRKILETVRKVRQACFALKETEDWLVYRVALLRYSSHTLSFDKRRERGECEPVQLMHALYSVEGLIYNLVADDFHLKTRAERPGSYPQRRRVSIDEAPWLLDCEGYDPPYHVDPSVVANDRTTNPEGWADPEDVNQITGADRLASVKYKDDQGRPRNPRGRTGLAGRGLLGLWGSNLSAVALVVRKNPDAGHHEILLGDWDDKNILEIPKGFVLPDETTDIALIRVLTQEAGWHPDAAKPELVFEGYTYDSRQTDHAWIESRAYLLSAEETPGIFEAGGDFDQIKWRPLDPGTINRIPSEQARFVREALTHLADSGRMEKAEAEALLAATG